MVFGPFHDCAFCERARAGRAGNHRRSEALHRMSLSDNLRRLARERIPTRRRSGSVLATSHDYATANHQQALATSH